MVSPSPRAPGARHAPTWWFVVGLAGVVMAAFGGVGAFGFVRWDDDINITQNPLLTAPWSASLVAQFFSSDQALRFKPLHWLLFRGIHDVFGFDPTAWHLFNLTLHLVAAMLFAVVLRRVFRRLDPGGDGRRHEIAAWLGATFWAVHPLRAEAVAWATASTYPLTTVCLLASFLCYLEAGDTARSPGRWLLASWLLAVCGYASYPVGVTFGLWLIVFDLWSRRARPGVGMASDPFWTKHAATYVWFLLPAAAAVGFTAWARIFSPGIFLEAPSVQSVGLSVRLVMAVASLGYLAWRLVWPVDLTPNMPPLADSPDTWLWVAAFTCAVGGAVLYTWRQRSRRPGLVLVVVGFAALSLPCLGLTERPTWPVDRYSYLSHLVLVGGVAGWFARRPAQVGSTFARMWIPACVALILALAWIAHRQAASWRDSDTLFTHMERHPDFARSPRQQGRIYILWANEAMATGRLARAGELLLRAQEIYLASIREAVGRGDYAEALTLSAHLGARVPLTPVMLRERGAWLLRLGRDREAQQQLLAAKEAMPDDPRVAALLLEAQERLRHPDRQRREK